MPEDIVQVNFESKLVYTWPLLNTFTNGVSFKESRTDMVAPWSDKNETVLYENDIGRLKFEESDEQVDEDCIVAIQYDGSWELRSIKDRYYKGNTWDLDYHSINFEFKYTLPYEER
jgi:hypothetical protein